jgi:ABC-2 type transport system ATP-binding protein
MLQSGMESKSGEGPGIGIASPAVPVLSAHGLKKKYGSRQVLRGVEFSIGAGQIVGITGENGSGKSTLLQILAGWIAPTHGTVTRRTSLGYCPQDTTVFDTLTVSENLRYFAQAIRLPEPAFRQRTAHLLGLLQLNKFEHHPAAELSGGSRQKLNLIVALLDDPELLLLDEPCSGLDWSTYLHFWEFANATRAAGKSIVIVSHLIHEQSYFDALYTMREGVLSS